ncbi:hypothetical protein BDP27DRAFT_1384512 [Rhodocollybia butyracea]|uniref:Uncharacterized protein n=1 Tax=Rhodocollybia butyracea TaxID=206335 RepID=A0A9P5PHP7_9AGAR|nr:hypothetical protein BDP27DRAFT_1384512 [Rhodocollybia butyracea]
MVTQYCSQERQKIHWPHNKPICQHTTSQVSSAISYASDENIAKNLLKLCSQHTLLLSCVGFQALQLKRLPSNIWQHALVVDLAPRSGAEGHRRFSVVSTRKVKRNFGDSLVLADLQRRDDRCRHNGGIGCLIVLVRCDGISQVMPIEVDPPSKISWDTRDDWHSDFQPITTTPLGTYYG